MLHNNQTALSITSACVLAVALVGCTTQAQQRWDEMTAQADTATRLVDQCFARVLETPVAQRLAKSFIFRRDEPGKLPKMLDHRYADKQMKRDILAYASDEQKCRKVAIEEWARVHPAFVGVLSRMYLKSDQLVLKLLRNEITIGKSNELGEQVLVEMEEEWQKTSNMIATDINRSHATEMQRRQAAAQAMQQWSYQQQLLQTQQQMLMPTDRPVQTNCRAIGNTLNCISQ